MAVSVQINPKYEELRKFIEGIPAIFEIGGREIYHLRNVIKVFKAPNGILVNVKRFHVPSGVNRLVYSWGIRKPKGERAFEYPEILLGKGIGTPKNTTEKQAACHFSTRGRKTSVPSSTSATMQTVLDTEL